MTTDLPTPASPPVKPSDWHKFQQRMADAGYTKVCVDGSPVFVHANGFKFEPFIWGKDGRMNWLQWRDGGTVPPF